MNAKLYTNSASAITVKPASYILLQHFKQSVGPVQQGKSDVGYLSCVVIVTLESILYNT